MKTYNYYLPNKDGTVFEGSTETNAIVIIGANGSGKTKLGAWIEQRDNNQTYRISAQRSLVFKEFIQQRSYEQSTNLLLFGNETKRINHDFRWGHDGFKHNYTSSLLNDYEYVLSALLAKKNLQSEKYISECRGLEKKGKEHNPVPEMVTDKLFRIWDTIFPHRQIDLSDGKVSAVYKEENKVIKYNGREMSDGERVALYLIAQALAIPNNKTIIIDEPEIHLHRSIMNRLWTAIEKEREDCLFIYITHDTHFAANHREAKKIWVKNFDGTNWEWEEIEDSQLPEQLLLDILGNRKPVIFVEGTSGSFDTKLYSIIYENYYVVPCGSCSSVIINTKAMNNTNQLHELKCYGIIDRDYRTEYEIKKLKEENIFAIDVAEVENLFLVPEVLNVVNHVLGFEDNTIIEKVKKYIIEDRFEKEIKKQVKESILVEIKYRLSVVDISDVSGSVLEQSLEGLIGKKYEEMYCERYNIFDDFYKSRNYTEILKIYNRKGLVESVGCFWDIKNKGYCDFVLRQFRTENRERLLNAFLKYLPKEISYL